MKNGFTIIEVLIVIALIGIISATSFFSFAKVNDASTKNEYNHKVQMFISSALVYVDNNKSLRQKVYGDKSSVNVSLKVLADQGLIEYDIINPLSKDKFNYESYIKIYYEDEVKGEFYIIK